MQLECSDSDESLACPVGLQSTPSSVICATVEGREILSAATTSAAVEDNGYTCLSRSWGVVRELRLRRVSVSAGAWLDGQVQLRGQPLNFLRLRPRPDVQPGPCPRGSGIEGSARNGLRPNRQRAHREAGLANM
jgi:hypothetical protein